jgi:hypothetical protein
MAHVRSWHLADIAALPNVRFAPEADVPTTTRLTRSRHIELSKAVALAHTWGCRDMGCAFGFAFLLDGAAHYQFLNFIPIRLIAISFKPLLALAVLLTGAY